MASVPVRKLSKDQQRRRVHLRVRTRVIGTPERPRLNVYRSVGHIYAQVIDDRSGRTLISASSVDKETKKGLKGGGNIASAKAVGKIVADRSGRTLISASSVDKETKKGLKGGGNIASAKAVGKIVADRAKAAGVTKVVFDRGGYKYHGRVKALADAAREAGLQF